MQASLQWMNSAGEQYSPGGGRAGRAQLSNYSVEYREWGEGPPLLVVPGLAGGFGLLGPLVRELESSFRVISYQLRGEDDCFTIDASFGLRISSKTWRILGFPLPGASGSSWRIVWRRVGSRICRQISQ